MCKFLIGDGSTWYKCSFTKQKCGYQRYCPERKQYLPSCEKCPICRNKATQKK